MPDGKMYQTYEKTIGQSTNKPWVAWGINCLIECECPDCLYGEHRVDAFNLGSNQGWYDTHAQAQAIAEKLNGRS